MSWIVRDYKCSSCGNVAEQMVRRAEPELVEPCACGGIVLPVLSAVRGKVKICSFNRGKSDKPPPGAMDTRALADGQPLDEWRAERRKVHQAARRKQIREMFRG